MDWQQASVSELFDGAEALYRVPAYQREYQWQEADVRELWTDLMSLYRDLQDDVETSRPHFLGILLLQAASGNDRRKVIIDGQQRLVTLLLLQAAMYHHEADEEERAFRPDHMLFHPVDDDGRPIGPRIAAQVQDEDVLYATLRGGNGWRTWYASVRKKSRSGSLSPRIQAAYVFFRYLLWLGEACEELADSDIALPLYRASDEKSAKRAEEVWFERGTEPRRLDVSLLRKAVRDNVKLVRLIVGEQDQDAQAIFQSINAKRRPLEQWDLVRNEMFLALPAAERDDLYRGPWQSIESRVGSSRYDGQRGDSRDLFIYDFLIAEGEHGRQHGIAKNRGYLHLRQLRRRRGIMDGSGELLRFVRDEFLVAGRLWTMAIGCAGEQIEAGSHTAAVRSSLETIIRMSAGPMTPLALHVLQKHARQQIDHARLAIELRLIEVFIVRQIAAGTSMSPLRSAMVTLMNNLVTRTVPSDLQELLFGGVAKFPITEDKRIRGILHKSAFYGKSALLSRLQLGALFRGLEKSLGGGAANPLPYGNSGTDFSVEHLFPQSALTKSTEWDDDLRSWAVTKARYRTHVHRLGNLTLITNDGNKRLRTKRFAEKREYLTSGAAGKIAATGHPILSISQGLSGFDRWTPSEIDERTRALTDLVLKTWPNP